MKPASKGRNILSKDGLKALTTSIWGSEEAAAAAEEGVKKALLQRDEARLQRDKARQQRDALREELNELKQRIEELEERREAESQTRNDLAEAIDPRLAHEDPARYATLLKRELVAESARVQALERNLDHALRRTSDLETRLSRTRAILAIALDGGDVEAAAAAAELGQDSAGSLTALSRALLETLRHLPTLQSAKLAPIGAGAGPDPVAVVLTPAPIDAEPLGDEAPDVTDPRSDDETFDESAAALEAQDTDDEDPDVVDDARPAPGSSAFAATTDEPLASVSHAPGDVVARLPDPAVMKGKLLSAARVAKVAEERQLQIDAFMADGEFARIQALKDIHKGRRAFIVGNGPSLATQDLSKLDGEITFVANWFANHDGFDEMKPKYYTISSHEMFGGWARQNPVLNAKFVEKLTRHGHRPEMFFSHRFREALANDPAMADYDRRFLIFDRPKFLADEAGGLEFDLAQPMHDGYTVLLTFCVPLAVHMGITEIYMVGCDCDYAIQTNTDARAYFYAPSEHATSSTKAENINRIWGENGPLFRVYELARDACAERGVQMFNATAGGKLEVLPRASYDEVLSVRSAAAEA